MRTIATLRALLNKQDKIILTGLLFLSIIVSFVETFSITAVMVFISIATNVGQMSSNGYTHKLKMWLGCTTHTQFVMTFGAALIIFYLFRGVLGLVHIYAMSRFAHSRQHRFSTLLFSRFLRFSYLDYTNKNSAWSAQAIFSNTGTLTQVVFALLIVIAEFFTVLCIYGMMFMVNWKMTLVLTCFLSVKSLLIIKAFAKHIQRAGKTSQKFGLDAAKVYNATVGNYKLIKLGCHGSETVNTFSQATLAQSRSQIVFTTLQNSPKFVLETVGFILLISIILFVLARHSDVSSVIPIISMYALAFYRLLPSLSKIISSINQINFGQAALEGVYRYLHLETEQLSSKTVTFHHHLHLQNLRFGYGADSDVLRGVTMTMVKGDRIAFVGPSGVGKSTLVDVVMGLYQPTSGQIVIDQTVLDNQNLADWRQKIGYIPQSIYLFDGSVADNIAFGRVYDEQKIVASLKKAQMYDFIMAQQGLATMVGEGGIKLSGGQKQRIAIARAIYNDPELLVLDEATSALDHETEADIMDQIYQLSGNVTLLIIAHRLSTVARCDKIYKIDDGQLVLVSFNDIAQQPARVAVSA